MVDVLPVDAADPATATLVTERMSAYAAAGGAEVAGGSGGSGRPAGSGRSRGGDAGGGSGVPPPIGDLIVPG
jgi:hypothetical protein